MSIVQISKIIHRSGNIDSLPQLDGAEFGLAVDYSSVPGTALNRLFIGPIVPVVSNSAPLANNIEILTQYSTISKLANGNSNVNIPIANGNITMSVAGNANVVVITGTGANINGNAYVSGNIVIPSIGSNTQLLYNNNGNIGAANKLGFDNVTGQLISNVSAPTPPFVVTSTTVVNNLNAFRVGNIITFDITGGANPGVSYDGNAVVLVDYHTVGAAEAANPALNNWFAKGISNPANSTGMDAGIGSIYGAWTLAAGSTFQATYADLAEYYLADAHYESGTVLEFGGAHEVTLAEDETTRVAGVVSTNPAYGMNADLKGEHTVALALQGRVPCKVRGNIRKGDMMISAGGGYARPTHSPKMGTIIGKALENFSGEGVIEIAVGRL